MKHHLPISCLLIAVGCVASLRLNAALVDLTDGYAGMIQQPDYTNRINGICTNQLVLTNSGTAGHPMTILFAPGAKLSKPTWYDGVHNCAIYNNGNNWITIDGGSNGLIEATANGTTNSFPNNADCRGVIIEQQVNNDIVRNLTISNMYVRTSTNDPAANGAGMSLQFLSGGHDLTVANCRSYQSGNHFFLNYSVGNSNYFVYSNTVVAYSVGINIGNANSLGTLTNCLIYGNDCSDAATWGGVSAIHCDSIHIYSVGANSLITGLRAYGNFLHGNPGVQSTSYLYLEGVIESALVYNNLFVCDGPGIPAVSFLDVKGCSNAIVANNTFVSKYPGGGGNAIQLQGWYDTERSTFTNNLFLGFNFAWYETTSGMIQAADYDAIYPTSTSYRRLGTTLDFAGWQGQGMDVHGINAASAPLDANYHPTNSISGTSLASLFTTDFTGATRSAWTVGAFEGGATNAPPAATGYRGRFK